MLFKDNCERTEGAVETRESTFEYLQRSNRPSAIQRCRWINELFEELPADKRAGFESRIKSRKSSEFLSALFEMQVHRILRRLDFSVEIEADFPGTRQKIDFLARSEEGQSVYVEATVCGFGQGKLSENSNEHDAAEKIRKNIPSPHSDLWLEIVEVGGKLGTLHKTLAKEFVVKPFLELLENHSEGEVHQIHSRWGLSRPWLFPSTEIREGNWVLKGTLWPPLNPSCKGQIWGPERGGVVDGTTPLLESLQEKAKKWKNADFRGIPFLIAVNICHSDFDGHEDDVNRALFEYVDVRERTENFRKSLTRVNGVMIVNNAVLGNELGAGVRLFRNGDTHIPESLHFLFEEQKLGNLLGIES